MYCIPYSWPSVVHFNALFDDIICKIYRPKVHTITVVILEWRSGLKKRSSKTIDIVSYALKVSVNGVTCVFIVLFRSKKYI